MFKIIGTDGKQYGPVTAGQLKQWIGQNLVNAQTLVQIEGTQEWKALATLPDFASEVGKPIAPPIIGCFPPNMSARASSKIAAGICGILLGSLGIHKFILGYTGPAVIMLLVTVLTCGWGGLVMGIFGIIEGIIYLTKSDDEFVRTYVDGRKEWF